MPPSQPGSSSKPGSGRPWQWSGGRNHQPPNPWPTAPEAWLPGGLCGPPGPQRQAGPLAPSSAGQSASTGGWPWAQGHGAQHRCSS
eukprot:7848810-Lingulodinium_polyedra.AAC.1